MAKRVFLIVLDSFGIGSLPDAGAFGDAGANTIASAAKSVKFHLPEMRAMGLMNIEGVGAGEKAERPSGSFARMRERSMGKDTTIGHWEMAGLISPLPLPTFPDGFPDELIREFERAAGRGVLCNKPYSGTEAIRDYGEEHLSTGKLIVYTSADSVFQIAANEALVPPDELYGICRTARELLRGPYAVGRVIARPFEGTNRDDFRRTANRHDFSLKPPRATMLTLLQKAGCDTIGVGKIHDIFAGDGLTESIPTKSNRQGMDAAMELQRRDFEGIAFVNLVDFDMLYGHRRDVDGYANALSEFDARLGEFLPRMRKEDLLILTADHGCDPGYSRSTDHTREYVPMLIGGAPVRKGANLGTRESFADIAASVLEYFGVFPQCDGESFLGQVLR